MKHDRRAVVLWITGCATLTACGGGGGDGTSEAERQSAQDASDTVTAIHSSQQNDYLASANALVAQYAAAGRRSSTYRGLGDLFIQSVEQFLVRASNYLSGRSVNDRRTVSSLLLTLRNEDKVYIRNRVTPLSPLTPTQLADYLTQLDTQIDTAYTASGLL
jgi:hypothetical protein